MKPTWQRVQREQGKERHFLSTDPRSTISSLNSRAISADISRHDTGESHKPLASSTPEPILNKQVKNLRHDAQMRKSSCDVVEDVVAVKVDVEVAVLVVSGLLP